MNKRMMKRVYKAFGLYLSSEFALPELTDVTGKDVPIDVVIEAADLTREWAERGGEERKSIANEEIVMFRVDGAATYLIQNGTKIVVSQAEDAEPDKVRLYLLGSCMGALLLQRRVLPMHGSAVAVNGKAIAFVGESGAGKSTLASAFLQRGYPLLSDDVIPVRFSKGNPYVMPSYPQQKLWQNSLNGFGIDSAKYKPIYERFTKFAVPVQQQYCSDPMPLGAVFEIVAPGGEEESFRRIEQMERFATVFRHTYRNFLIKPLHLMEWHFQVSAQMISRIELFRKVRPESGFTADDMVTEILDALRKREEAVR